MKDDEAGRKLCRTIYRNISFELLADLLLVWIANYMKICA